MFDDDVDFINVQYMDLLMVIMNHGLKNRPLFFKIAINNLILSKLY